MQVIRDLMVCTDCASILANADTSGIDDADVLKACEKGVEALGTNVCAGDSSQDDEFSWSACDCCSGGLGGYRYHFVKLGN
jgi:hypothetical protein